MTRSGDRDGSESWKPARSEGHGERSPRPETETGQWLAIPPPVRARSRDGAEPVPRAQGRRRFSLRGSRERKLRQQLAQARAEIESLQVEMRVMRDTILELERERETLRAAAKSSSRPRSSRKRAAGTAKGKKRPRRVVDINAVSAERLVQLGLTPAQAGSVVKLRERIGGFRSVEELERVPKLTAAALEKLTARVGVRPR